MTLAPWFFIWSSSFLKVTRTYIQAWMSLNFCKIQSLATRLAAFEHLTRFPLWFKFFLVLADNQNRHNILTVCLNLFLITVSNSELPAIEHHKLWSDQTLCWISGERSLPIRLLVCLNYLGLCPFITTCSPAYLDCFISTKRIAPWYRDYSFVLFI